MGSRRSVVLGLVVAAALAGSRCGGCGGEGAGDEDAGRDAGSPVDAGGADAGGDGGSQDAGEIDGGADAGADAGSDAGTLTLQQYCDLQAPALCDFFARCDVAMSDTACESDCAISSDTLRCRALLAAEKDGRIAFDGAQARACIDALSSTMPCAEAPRGFVPLWLLGPDAIPACPAAFTGQVARNGPCYVDEECAAGDSCTAALGSCPGACVARKGIGDAASRAGECQSGLYLYGGAALTCQALASPGASCAPLELAGPLQSCTPGHFCNPATEVCTPVAGVGGGCPSHQGCLPNLQCVDGECHPLAPYGANCDVLGIACKVGLSCNAPSPFGPGTCDGLHGLGGGCWTYGECARGYFCDGANPLDFPPLRGSCAEAKALGAACLLYEAYSCAPGLFCAGTNGGASAGTCAAQKSEGALCDVNEIEECTADLFCDNGFCAPLYCRDPSP